MSNAKRNSPSKKATSIHLMHQQRTILREPEYSHRGEKSSTMNTVGNAPPLPTAKQVSETSHTARRSCLG
eukprot:6349493-Amphidinium_carterae.1